MRGPRSARRRPSAPRRRPRTGSRSRDTADSYALERPLDSPPGSPMKGSRSPRKACTATSLAAFSTHGPVPPTTRCLARQPQARERVLVRRLEGQRRRPRRGRAAHRHVDPLRVVQRVGDRHPHVRVPICASAAPSHSVDQRVHDRLRVNDDLDPVVGPPNRWWASITSRPLFISVAESIVILPPISQVGCWSASSTVTPSSSARVRPRNGPPDAVSRSLFDRARPARRRSAGRAPSAPSRPE